MIGLLIFRARKDERLSWRQAVRYLRRSASLALIRLVVLNFVVLSAYNYAERYFEAANIDLICMDLILVEWLTAINLSNVSLSLMVTNECHFKR